jgi:hypothetical protein
MAGDKLNTYGVDSEELPIMQGSWRPKSARKKTRPDSGKTRPDSGKTLLDSGKRTRPDSGKSPSSSLAGSGRQRAETVEQRAESREQIVLAGSGSIGEANRGRSQSAASGYIRSLTSAFSLTSFYSPRGSEGASVGRRASTSTTLVSVSSEELAIADLKREARRLRAIENEVYFGGLNYSSMTITFWV